MPPPRKTECILLFNPTTQSFTLEKLSSTFTFNANVYALAHPPLPLRPPIPDGEDDDASAGEKEDDNPFDYRHFINKKSTTKTRAEQKAEREERRKEALKRAGKGAPEDDEPEEEDEDELPGLGITYDRPKIGGKGFLPSPIGPKKVGGKSPFGGKKPVAVSPGVPLPSPAHVHRGGDSSSDEDESDEADDEDEVSDDETAALPPPPLPRPPITRKPLVPRNTAAAAAAARRKAQQEEPEEMVFPEPSQPLHIEEPSEDEISDCDESDDDAPPPSHPDSAEVAVQEEDEEDDGFDLAELLEKELENGDGGDLDMDAEGEVDLEGEADAEADGEIIFEDDEVAPPRGPPKVVGLGIGAAGVPISFGQMMGGGVEDESESESEEE